MVTVPDLASRLQRHMSLRQNMTLHNSTNVWKPAGMQSECSESVTHWSRKTQVWAAVVKIGNIVVQYSCNAQCGCSSTKATTIWKREPQRFLKTTWDAFLAHRVAETVFTSIVFHWSDRFWTIDAKWIKVQNLQYKVCGAKCPTGKVAWQSPLAFKKK